MKNQDQEQPATKSKQILSDWNNPEFIKEITELISNKKSRKLKSILEESHPADIAEALGAINIENAIYLFRLCDEETRGLILVEMTEELQSIFVEKLNLKEISPIIGNMESDEATSLISEISEEKAEEILNSIDKEDSSKIRSQLNFNENTAGRLMSKDYAVVQENETARKGIINLRKASRETENIYVVYVTDENGILKGYVKLKDLFLASPTARISRIMIPSVKALHYDLDQEEVARFFRKYDYVSAPVIDDAGYMLGRITVDDILDIVEEEASEDILRLGGVSEDERLTTSLWDSVRRRAVWLNVYLITAVMAAAVVTMFENTIQKIVVLAALMPAVAGMGGNAGTQSITIVVRNLATGDLSVKNSFTAIKKEVFIGIANGLILGLVTGGLVYLFKQTVMLSFVIGLAMFLNLIVAGFVGSSIPLLLKYFRIDPAIASSIFVTACTDAFGFFCFLGLATLFINFL